MNDYNPKKRGNLWDQAPQSQERVKAKILLP